MRSACGKGLGRISSGVAGKGLETWITCLVEFGSQGFVMFYGRRLLVTQPPTPPN